MTSSVATAHSEEISFVRKAFGVRTCCTLNSWVLVLAFVKMVYSCFHLGLASFTLTLIFLTVSGSADLGSRSFLLLTAIPYFTLSAIFSTLTCRIFIIIAEQREPERLSRQIMYFAILKVISSATLVPLMAHYGHGIAPGNEILFNSLAASDTALATLYILLIYYYQRSFKDSRHERSEVILVSDISDADKYQEKKAMV